MSTVHTSGPWVAHQRPTAPLEYGHHVTTEYGLTICSVTYQLPARVSGQVVEVERIANARLIAAAPELLVALKRLTDLAIGPAGGVTQADKRAAIEMALAAIAKAVGEQP